MSTSARPASERIRLISEVGLSIALATVLGMMKIWQMPQGGEVSLAMLPILLLAFRRGTGPAVIAGVLYGVVDAQLNPYVVHWAQYILDYPLAYGLVGLAGLLSRKIVAVDEQKRRFVVPITFGVAIAALGRYAAHTLSGVIFFAEYAEGQPVLLYSAVYNSSVLISAVACVVAAVAIVPVLARVVPVWREA